MQSRENLYEKQPFAVELPRWVTGLQMERPGQGAGALRLKWDADPAAQSYSLWKRIPGATVYPQWELIEDRIRTNGFIVRAVDHGTFAVTARTSAKRRLEGTVNFAEYLLFQADESPIVEQIVVGKEESHIENISWTDDSLPEKQEVWRIFEGVSRGNEKDAEAVLESFRGLVTAFEAKDLDRLMSFYSPDYRDSNGYGTEYVRRAWLWWFQRTVIPYVVAQVRAWDMSKAGEGLVSFTSWNRFRGTIVWDEPFGYHGRVRIPRHDGDRVTWSWRRTAQN